MSKIELTQIDRANISNISANHNLNYSIVEKAYQEMLNKAYAGKKFKEMIEKIKTEKIKK